MQNKQTPRPNPPEKAPFIRNVLIKAVILFLLINFAFAVIPVDAPLGRLTGYNTLFAGRARFPFGENPAEAHNLSLYNLDAMFASHNIDAGSKPDDEYRIIVIGDSATWGTLLTNDETLSGLINHANLTTCDGRTLRAYNLGYPTMSLIKDVMILQQAQAYQPDLIIWAVTLESFPVNRQFASPIAANNATRIAALIADYDLNLDVHDPALIYPDFWQRTLIGRRRALADLLRLQLYGVYWSGTGIDQAYGTFTPAQRDLADVVDYYAIPQDDSFINALALDVLHAGFKLAGDAPVLLINEPILISSGQNSHLRYNFYYPRWAYDRYRDILAGQATQNGWQYLDVWDQIPESGFTNSAVHLSAQAMQTYYNLVENLLLEQTCR